MTPTRDDPDRLFAAYLNEIAGEASAANGGPGPGLGLTIRQRAAAESRARQARFGGLLVAALVIGSVAILSRYSSLESSGASSTPGANQAILAIEGALPDSDALPPETSAWVTRATADATDHGQEAKTLVPLAVHVGEGEAFIWFRDYETGTQVLAQYAGIDPAGAPVVGIYAPSPKTVGPSAWELERIADAIAKASELQAAVGPPVSSIGTSVSLCPSGHGACARVKVSGSILKPPTDGPGLAAVAIVDLRSLVVSLVLPPEMTPETNTPEANVGSF